MQGRLRPLTLLQLLSIASRSAFFTAHSKSSDMTNTPSSLQLPNKSKTDLSQTVCGLFLLVYPFG